MGKRANGEGSAPRKRPDGRWEARYVDADGKRKSFYGQTQREVATKLREVLRNRDTGVPTPTPGRLTVAAFLDKWLATKVPPATRPNTYRQYEYLIRAHLKPGLGRIGLGKLTGLHVQTFLSEKQAASPSGKALSNVTVAAMQRILTMALNDAVRWNLAGHNAAERANGPKVEKRKPVVLTTEQARQIVDAFAGHRFRTMVAVALYLGLRQGELLGLRWADVDLDRRKLHVRQQWQRGPDGQWAFLPPKSEAGVRSIPLPAPILDELRAQKVRVLELRLATGEQWRYHDLVFPSAVGTPLNPSDVSKEFKRVLAAADLDPMRFHDQRHGFATLALSQGIDLKTIQDIGGWSECSQVVHT